MKIKIVVLILISLLGITVSASIAQQNQNVPKTDSEVEKLKIQFQTVKNEKMEIETKLAEANAKLINTDIDKLKGELREFNNDWLKAWTTWFWTIIGIFIAILLGVSYVFWYWLRSRTDKLIENEVEKSLNGFKDAVGNLNEIRNQLLILEEAYTYTVLQGFDHSYFWNQDLDFKEIRALREDTLLRILDDNTYLLSIRFKAVAVLAERKSPQLVSSTLRLLNTVVDSDLGSDLYPESWLEIEDSMQRLVSFIGQIHTQESYEELKKYLISLITNNPKNKDLFLTHTAFSLGWVSLKLNFGDSVSVLRLAIPHLQVGQSDINALKNFARHFDVFNDSEGIKEILTYHAADKIPELEEKCLELLEKHDPDFVKEWKSQKQTAKTENEESP